jgi:ketosteroid isomerase-like protein
MTRASRQPRLGALVALVAPFVLGGPGCAPASPAKASAGAPAAGPDFATTLDRHLRAVEGRDLATLMGTVSDRELMLILPNGKVVGSPAAFEALHREWFADPNWTIKFHVEKTVETAELSYAIATYDYEERPPGGAPVRKRRYLQLVFRKYDAGWKLVHDQNTPVEGAA